MVQNRYHNPLCAEETKLTKTNVMDKIFGLFMSVPGRVSEANIKRLAERYGYAKFAQSLLLIFFLLPLRDVFIN